MDGLCGARMWILMRYLILYSMCKSIKNEWFSVQFIADSIMIYISMHLTIDDNLFQQNKIKN